VTRATIFELASAMEIEFVENRFNNSQPIQCRRDDGHEYQLCIVPISKFNNRPFRMPIPGPITKALMSAFGKLVDCDFVERAVKLSSGSAGK